MEEIRVYQALQWASSFLEERNRETNIAYILMEHHLDVTSTILHSQLREILQPSIWMAFRRDVTAHAQTGQPVQHLTGYAHFYGYQFKVNEHVLVPRFETEELVYHVIEEVKSWKQEEPLTIVDLGTGSGVIAICLALALPQANVYAVDISEEALAIAKENAEALGANVSFLQGNFLEPVMAENIAPTMIVSNPPYIARSAETKLADTVKNFDPALALYADNEGLAAYEQIIHQLKSLEAVKHVYFEIGYDQGAAVQQMMQEQFPLGHVAIVQDINEKDRIVTANIAVDV